MTSSRGLGSTLVKIARSQRLLHQQPTGRRGRLTPSSGGEDLGLTATQVGLVTAIPLLGGSLFRPIMGMLGDRMGRRKLLLIGAAGFAAASVLAAFASSAPMLILARGLLGISAATLAPCSMAILVAAEI